MSLIGMICVWYPEHPVVVHVKWCVREQMIAIYVWRTMRGGFIQAVRLFDQWHRLSFPVLIWKKASSSTQAYSLPPPVSSPSASSSSKHPVHLHSTGMPRSLSLTSAAHTYAHMGSWRHSEHKHDWWQSFIWSPKVQKTWDSSQTIWWTVEGFICEMCFLSQLMLSWVTRAADVSSLSVQWQT